MPGLKSLLPGPERTTAVGRAPSPSASRTSVESQAVFSTPSKNIACAMEPSFTRCDISERSWSAPPKPASCELDYGNGLAINAGTAGITCAGDTVLGAPRILPYGQAVRVGTVACTSSAAGVRCADQATGHGFLLAKESYQVF
jgi:hypothetical protein